MHWIHGARLRLAMACIAFLAATTVAAPGRADTRVFHDANDTRSQLDFATVEQHHYRHPESGQRMLAYTITFHDGWRVSRWGTARIEFDISTDEDRAMERQIYIDAPAGNLVAEVRSPRSGFVHGYAKVTHPDKRTLYVQFPRKLLGRGVAGYRWSLFSAFHASGYDGCDSNQDAIPVCTDRLPDTGSRRHTLS